MNLSSIVQSRHSCKAFDPSRQLSPEQLQQVQDLLRFAPSSTNVQAWHFYLASSSSGKEKVAQGMAGAAYAYNAKKVRDAALTVLLCVPLDVPPAHTQQVLAQEAADGRFADAQTQAQRLAMCLSSVDKHRQAGDLPAWLERQLYIALGQVLLGAALLGLDACPIEGFDTAVMDAALDLPQQGLRSVVAVALGWRSADDFNASLPKSRLSPQQVFTWM